MFQIPFFQRDSEFKSLGIDVGTTAVKVLEPENLSYSTAYLDKYSVFDTDSYTEDLIGKTIDKAWSRLNLRKEFDRVLLSLPPAFFKARTKEIMIERNKEGKIAKKEKKDLINKARKKIKKDVSTELGILKSDIYFKDWNLISVEIDGYSVSDLQGYNGQRVRMKFLVVFLLNKFLRLRDVIEEKLKGEVELVHLAQGFLKNKDNFKDGVYLDVGGEATQLLLIKNQGLEFVGETRTGGRRFSQVLADNLGLTELRSKALKERYSQEELSDEVAGAIEKMLRERKIEWLKEIKGILKEQKAKSLPSTFYLFGGGSKLNEIQRVITQEQWDSFAFLGPVEVKYLTPQSFNLNFLDVQYTALSLIMNSHE